LLICEIGVGYQHDSFDSQASKINSLNIPWLYWEIIPGQETYGQYDYEISTSGGQRDNIRSKINEAISRPIANGLEGFSKYLNKDRSMPTTPTQPQPQPTTPAPTPNNPTCDVTTCDWVGHCFGTTCGSDKDCTNDLACVSGKCGCAQ